MRMLPVGHTLEKHCTLATFNYGFNLFTDYFAKITLHEKKELVCIIQHYAPSIYKVPMERIWSLWDTTTICRAISSMKNFSDLSRSLRFAEHDLDLPIQGEFLG